MAGLLPGDSSHHGTSENGPTSRNSQDRPEEVACWYFSRREIEESSPSRRDAIDLKKETYLRKSYCTFLQDLGMRLKVPQVTIATAIIFCHRFFIRQSHAKNDRRTIATVCMFLAGKVEETPRPLKDVIIVSYEIIHKKDSSAPQRIRQQKEVYEQQKELILLGERVVLATLGFDLNVHHPYKPLVEAIKKFKVAQNALAQVAWNFVNDGLRTSLCLQFKPHHIAAGAIFLAAKFLKVKLPSDGDKVWWQEFDVTPRQLEEVSNQMLELYEQNRVPQSQGSEMEGSAGGASSHRPQKISSATEEQASKQPSSRSATEHLHPENDGASSRMDQNNEVNDDGSGEMGSVITDHKADAETKDNQHPEQLFHKKNMREVPNKSKSGLERICEDQGRSGERNNNAEAGEWRDDGASHKSSSIGDRNLDIQEVPVSQSPKDAIKMIDEDKVKAIREKRRKSRSEPTRKKDFMDEDDLIEKELEDIEIPIEDEKIKREQKQIWLKQHENSDHGEVGDGNYLSTEGESSRGLGAENAEEGEMVDDGSPTLNSQNRRAGSSVDRKLEGKKYHEYKSSYSHDNIEDGHKLSRPSYGDREYRRHAQENHL